MKHSDEKRKMELLEDGEERTQTQGGEKNFRRNKPEMEEGRTAERHSDTIPKIQTELRKQICTTDTRTPDQQRETQKERMKNIGGEAR